MIEPPFKIFYNNRPFKICYLLDVKNTSFEDVLEIIVYCNKLWGGRYNPIILTDGYTISEEDSRFLKSYDPDIIKSYLKLSDALISKFEIELTPFLIEVPFENENKKTPYVNEHVAQYLITPSLIRNFTNHILPSTISLFYFDLNTKAEVSQNILNFIKINFGLYGNTLYDEMNLGDSPKEMFEISNDSNFIISFEELIKGKLRVFPNQFACNTNIFFEPQNYNLAQTDFSLIIGDSVNELIYFWNGIFSRPKFDLSTLRSLWLSKEMAIDPNYTGVLRSFIDKYCSSGNGNKAINLISNSLTQEELQEIGELFTKDLFIHKEYKIKSNYSFPELNDYQYYRNIKSWNYHQANSKDEIFEIKLPKYIDDPSNHMSWITDIAIEYKSKRFKDILGPQYWLQFPKRNWVTAIQNPHSRVTNSNFLSTISSGSLPKVKIKVYDDFYIFQDLLTSKQMEKYYPINDPRNNLQNPLFKDINFSDKGNYLRGILKLFKGLFAASNCLNENYWRIIFDTMSNRIKVNNEVEMEKIKEKLSINIKSFIKENNLGVSQLKICRIKR